MRLAQAPLAISSATASLCTIRYATHTDRGYSAQCSMSHALLRIFGSGDDNSLEYRRISSFVSRLPWGPSDFLAIRASLLLMAWCWVDWVRVEHEWSRASFVYQCLRRLGPPFQKFFEKVCRDH